MMHSDSLFYEVFQTSPHVFFELIGAPLPEQGLYSLVSQEVKQTRFQIDGILLPHHRRSTLPIYFLEVMGYKPKQGKHFYQELITEIHLYLNDYQPRNNWRAVVIYTQRSFDPGLPIHLSEYAQGDRLQRLYLDRLPETMQGRSLEVSAIQLMGVKKRSAAAHARQLIERVGVEVVDATARQDILELIQTICVYKFPELTRREVEEMLGLSELKQTRVYQEAVEEGGLKAKLEAIPRLLQLGLDADQIAQALALPVDQVRRAMEQQPSN
jgi:predicted transposase/invertase (TIGR01784 family)